MIEPTDEMREAFERAFEFATSDDEVVINRQAIRAGLAAALAIVERDYDVRERSPLCDNRHPSAPYLCELPRDHTYDGHLTYSGPIVWWPR